MEEPIVISFYTDDWEYPKYVERIVENCQRLGLLYNVDKKELISNYSTTKPFFIRDCIHKFQKPVIWMNLNGDLLRSPNLAGLQTDFAACTHPDKKDTDRDWTTGILWFNYTSPSLDLLDLWCHKASLGTDEETFDAAWKEMRGQVIPCILPEQYHFVRHSSDLSIPDGTIFFEDLSSKD